MDIFKKPSDLINELIINKALLSQLLEDYKGKPRGNIFNKRLAYYQRKIKKNDDLLKNYHLTYSTRCVIHWELVVEVEIENKRLENMMTMNKALRIYMDARINRDEITKLIRYQLDCIIISVKQLGEPVELGRIKFL